MCWCINHSCVLFSPCYRQLPIALPYIGAYLDQIYSLEMSSKTYNPNGLVNFAKMTKLSSIVRTALQYQRERFKFEHRVDVSSTWFCGRLRIDNAWFNGIWLVDVHTTRVAVSYADSMAYCSHVINHHCHVIFNFLTADGLCNGCEASFWEWPFWTLHETRALLTLNSALICH